MGRENVYFIPKQSMAEDCCTPKMKGEIGLKYWQFVRFEVSIEALCFREKNTGQEYYMREAKKGTLMWYRFNADNLEVVDRVDKKTKILCIDLALRKRPQDMYSWFQQLKRTNSKGYHLVKSRLLKKYNFLCDSLRKQEQIIKYTDSESEEGQQKIKSAQAKIERLNKEMPNSEIITILLQK